LQAPAVTGEKLGWVILIPVKPDPARYYDRLFVCPGSLHLEHELHMPRFQAWQTRDLSFDPHIFTDEVLRQTDRQDLVGAKQTPEKTAQQPGRQVPERFQPQGGGYAQQQSPSPGKGG